MSGRAIAASPTHALELAHATLVRGSAVGGPPPRAAPDDDLLVDPVRVRVLGNRLRELDRFLNVMADEAALALGLAGHDAPAFARLRNTPNKVRAVRGMMRLASPDHERLRAIGRISACLHHCGGRAHAASLWDDLALGAARSPRAAPGTRLALTRRTFERICRSYRATADALMREVGERRLP